MNLKHLIFVLFPLSFFGKKPIYINSISHHEGSRNEKVHIELGAIIIIFSENIIPTVLSKSEDDTTIATSLLFPNADYKDQDKDTLQKMFTGKGYTVSIQEVIKPHKGLLCLVSYQKNEVSFIYEAIKNSSGKSGYILRFINKNALKEIDDKTKERSLILLANNQSPRIVIDPGHGGIDFGASNNGIIEKELVLTVSKRVVQQLRSDGFDVLLTRSKDDFIALSDRTTIANQIGANIFVSIHANSAKNSAAHGIETFFYDNTYQDSQLYIYDLKALLNAYQKYTEYKTKNSELLAESIQKNICEHANLIRSEQLVNRKVKKGPFQVLMGSIAPAVLIEIGFISNDKEATELNKVSYQKKIAQGICAGIRFYFKETLRNYA